MEGGRREEGRGKQAAAAAAAGVPLINGAAAVGRTWQRETEEPRERERVRGETSICHVRVSMSALNWQNGSQNIKGMVRRGKGAKVSGCHMCMIQWESAFNPGPRQAPNCWLALASFLLGDRCRLPSSLTCPMPLAWRITL